MCLSQTRLGSLADLKGIGVSFNGRDGSALHLLSDSSGVVLQRRVSLITLIYVITNICPKRRPTLISGAAGTQPEQRYTSRQRPFLDFYLLSFSPVSDILPLFAAERREVSAAKKGSVSEHEEGHAQKQALNPLYYVLVLPCAAPTTRVCSVLAPLTDVKSELRQPVRVCVGI